MHHRALGTRARPGAGNKIFDCCFYVTNVMEHCARSHQIKRAALHRTGNNVTLTQFKIRCADFDQRQIEIKCDCYSVGSHTLRKPWLKSSCFHTRPRACALPASQRQATGYAAGASDRVAPTSTTAAAARPLGHDLKRIPPLHAIPMGVTLH
jgi:hypothetical protein